MNRIRPLLHCLIITLLLIAPQHLQAAVVPGAPLTLDDAVRIGLQRSRALEIARLDRDMAGEKIRETWAEVLPQISASSSYTRSLKSSILFFPESVFNPAAASTSFRSIPVSSDNAARASIDLRQTLIDWSAFAGIKAASIVRKMSDEAWRGAEATVVTDIKTAYFDALIAKEKLTIIEQSIARWEQARQDTRAMFRQGVVADIDTLQAWLSVENLRPDLMEAKNRVLTSTTTLKNVMGIPLDSTITPGGKLEVTAASYPAGSAEACREALDARPELRQLNYQVQAEGEKVNAARAEHFPLLSAFGKLETQTAFNDGTSLADSKWPVSSSVGLQLTMPIFTGFRNSSRVEQAKIGQLQSRTRYEELKAHIRAEVEIRLLNFRETQQRVEVQSKTISVAERSYTISRLRFKEGIGSRLELTDAELQLNKAKTNYLQAVYDNLIAATWLEKALGRRVAK